MTPDGWEDVALGDAVELTMGRQRSPKHATGDHVIPYVRAANVKDGRLALDDVLSMNFTPTEQAKYRLAPGDVLVTEGCGSITQLGASAAWNGEIAGPIGFQNTLLRLRAIPGVTDPAFVEVWARFAHSAGIWAEAASGTNIFHIGARRAVGVRVLLPPIDEQRRIATLLDRLEAVSVAARAVVSRAGAARSAAEENAALQLRNAPQVLLGDVADVVGGVTKDKKKQDAPDFVEVPYLRVANVQRGFLDLDEVSTIRVPENKARQLALQEGDVLLNEGGDRDKLGRGWIWEGQVAGCIHQNHVFRARMKDHDVWDPKFVSMWANTYGSHWFYVNGGQTSGIASISITRLKQFPLPLVDLDTQRRIVVQSDALRRVEAAAHRETAAAESLHRQVRQELLTGLHRIPSTYDPLVEAS